MASESAFMVANQLKTACDKTSSATITRAARVVARKLDNAAGAKFGDFVSVDIVGCNVLRNNLGHEIIFSDVEIKTTTCLHKIPLDITITSLGYSIGSPNRDYLLDVFVTRADFDDKKFKLS